MDISSVLISHLDLMSEWDYANNIGIDPYVLKLGSHKKVWWVCSMCGWHWQAVIKSRVNGCGCPVCSGRLPKIGINDFKTKHPELLDEWDYEANNTIGIAPESITERSGKKVHWVCRECGHKWVATPDKRVSGRGCPICAKGVQADRRVQKFISYKGSLFDNHPLLMKEWCEGRNSQLGLDPHRFTSKSNKEAYWVCSDCGYVWSAMIANRTKGVGCPVCSGKVIVHGQNDLESTHPELVKDWDYQKNDLLGLFPTNVSKGSEKEVFWKCHVCGHSWKTPVYSRAAGSGCPSCAFELGTSLPEQVLYYYIKQLFPSACNSYKPLWLMPAEIDIFIPELNIGIEYDGEGYHQSVLKDVQKDERCALEGIKILHIREPKCPKLPGASWSWSRVDKKYSSFDLMVSSALAEITNECGVDCVIDINYARDQKDILNQYKTRVKTRSIAMNDEAMSFWDWEKNDGLNPEIISAGSDIHVNWKCPDCEYSWCGRVADMNKRKRCPYCSGGILWKGHNDLATVYPRLAKEWNYERNEVHPTDVTKKSSMSVWWKCSTCGEEWKTSVCNRANGTGCPFCWQKRRKGKSSEE